MEKQKKKTRLNVRMIVYMMATLPMATVAIVVVYFASLTMRTGLEDEVLDGLTP